MVALTADDGALTRAELRARRVLAHRARDAYRDLLSPTNCDESER